MFEREEKKIIIAVMVILILAASIIAFWMPPLLAFRIVFGIVFLFFLPGFFIIEFVFARGVSIPSSEKIDWIERITLSIGLSIAVAPLVVYFFNQFGISINVFNIFLEIFGFLIFILLVVIIKIRSRRRE